MIYHEGRNYLFVHIQKTGGTSISDHLTRHCGARFVSPAHLQLRDVSFPGSRPFIFASVRNPWERLVSWYEMLLAKGVHNDFSRYMLHTDEPTGTVNFSVFLRRTEVIRENASAESVWSPVKGLIHHEEAGYRKSLAFNQFDYLTDQQGNFICDRVLNFSTLSREFAALMGKFYPATPIPALSHLNKRKARQDWRSYYASAEDREWVARLYRKDIEHFGFCFDS